MEIWEAIVMGFVQGATEFLPVSSSGHLVLSNTLLGLEEPDLLFDIILHVGTLIAVVGFYRRDVWAVLRDIFSGFFAALDNRTAEAFFEGEGSRLAALVVIATIPTGILGILLENLLDPEEGGERIITASVVCAILIANGVMLYANRWLMDREATGRSGLLTLWGVTPWVALAIGVIQGMAVMPGVSRSGATITLALLLGVARTQAARFSFLLSIPAILGALVLKFDLSLFTGGSALLLPYVAGALTASVVGLGCLVWLVRLLEKARFHHFAWYCWAVGIAGLILL